MAHPFLDRLARGPILGDGAMGTMLHARGAALDQCLEELCLTHPDWVSDIHLGYIKAGAEIIQTNTFGGSRSAPGGVRAGRQGQGNQLPRGQAGARGAGNQRAGGLDRRLRRTVGQTGALGGRLRQEEAAAAFAEQMGVLWEAGADLLILETFSDLDELALAVKMARETTDLPVVAEVTLGNDGVTTSGAGPAEVAHILAALGVDVAGVNCSLGPARMLEFIAEMHGAEPALRLAAMPNAGLPYRAGERMVYPSAPHYFAERVPQFLEAGTLLVGGCCGTTPAHIQAMRAALDEAAQRNAPDAGLTLQPIPMVRVSSPAFSETEEEAPAPTGLLAEAARGQIRRQRRGGSAARLQRGQDARRRTHRPGARRRRRQRGRQPDGTRAHGRAGPVRADPTAGGH